MIRTLLFDLAGTTIDCGCRAPVGVFLEVFRREGLSLDEATARGPMGTHKREHIRRLTALPQVAAAWQAVHGGPPTDADIDRMYALAEPLTLDILANYADPIPGVPALMDALRARGLRLGASTGYTRPMLEVLAPEMAARGWAPDALICASDVPAGRPAPYMNWRLAEQLGASAASEVLVCGDTPVDMEAARNAGMIAVGVTLTGNELGLSWEALAALEPEARAAHREQAGQRLRAAGAQHLIDSVLELPALLDRGGHTTA